MKSKVASHSNHQHPDTPTLHQEEAPHWYASNFDPNFSCLHEKRVSVSGGLGDGGKWVCDPHRIAHQVRERLEKGQNGCLVYILNDSVRGERKKSANFEGAIEDAIGEQCEIHIFDPNIKSGMAGTETENIHYHKWGFVSSLRSDGHTNKYETFQDTVAKLGHTNHIIDVMAVDCHGCEWKVYNDWFN